MSEKRYTFLGYHNSEYPRKKPKGWEFTKAEDRRNGRLNSKRAIVQNSIKRLKRYKIFEEPYDRIPDRLHEELEVIGGLVNMRLRWPEMDESMLGSDLSF